jgi:hypothetical protein
LGSETEGEETEGSEEENEEEDEETEEEIEDFLMCGGTYFWLRGLFGDGNRLLLLLLVWF